MSPSVSYSHARTHLKSVLDHVCEDHEPVLVTRQKGGNVVILSEEDYRSLEETAYLLRSPANARKLLAAVARDQAGEPGLPLADALRQLDLGEAPPDAG